MLTVAHIMRYCRNYFIKGSYRGQMEVSGGVFQWRGDLPADWIVLEGSRKNHGAFRADASGKFSGLTDETWEGRVIFLEPPQDFLDLCEEIILYDKDHPRGKLKSEQFGTYRYVRQEKEIPWQEAFAKDLQPWMHMFTEVKAE